MSSVSRSYRLCSTFLVSPASRFSECVRSSSSSSRAEEQQGGGYPDRTSITSVTDPVYDYLSQPYERPGQRRRQLAFPTSLTSLTSFSDPTYDYLQQSYERPYRARGSLTSPPSLTRESKGVPPM